MQPRSQNLPVEIPDDAPELLQELLEAADAVQSAWASLEYDPMRDPIHFMRIKDKREGDLADLKALLAFKWCNVDPLEYGVSITEAPGSHQPVAVFRPIAASKHESSEKTHTRGIPRELKDLLDPPICVDDDEALPEPDVSAGRECEAIRSFKRKVEVSLNARPHRRESVFAEMRRRRENFRLSSDGLSCWAILADGSEECFELTPNSATVVQRLYESYQRKEPGLSSGYLLEQLNDDDDDDDDQEQERRKPERRTKLIWDLFDSKAKKKLRRLIRSVPGRQGVYTLNLLKFD